MMKSFKTHLTSYLFLGALLFSVSAMADRSRDGGYQNKDKNSRHAQNYSAKPYKNEKHNFRNDRGYKGQHSARQQAHSNKHGYNNSNGHNNHGYQSNGHRNNRSGQQGFNGDYRNNRHFDNRNYNHNSYSHNNNRRFNNHGYNGYNGGHISHNYYKPKKYYKKWKKQNRRYWKNKYRHFYNYNVYRNDQYRYRPLRGLGHYFDRPGYGYGHWHEGGWCASYHDERFYQDYYSYYPYQDGWRHGDGDFGIWFSFNL